VVALGNVKNVKKIKRRGVRMTDEKKIFLVSKKVIDILKEEMLYHTGGGEADFNELMKKNSVELTPEELELLKQGLWDLYNCDDRGDELRQSLLKKLESVGVGTSEASADKGDKK
jgi:hypothetical protein